MPGEADAEALRWMQENAKFDDVRVSPVPLGQRFFSAGLEPDVDFLTALSRLFKTAPDPYGINPDTPPKRRDASWTSLAAGVPR